MIKQSLVRNKQLTIEAQTLLVHVQQTSLFIDGKRFRLLVDKIQLSGTLFYAKHNLFVELSSFLVQNKENVLFTKKQVLLIFCEGWMVEKFEAYATSKLFTVALQGRKKVLTFTFTLFLSFCPCKWRDNDNVLFKCWIIICMPKCDLAQSY